MMARVLRHRPSPVLVPESLGASRRLRRARSRLDGGPLPKSELALYDRSTVLYDAFLGPKPGTVVALGPPLENLARAILPLRASVAGRRVRCRVRKFGQLWTWTFNVGGEDKEPFDLELAFRGFSASVPVGRREAPSRRAEVALMTLQKDNPLPWIEDWCRWHHVLHGVEEIALYDNGSANADELVAMLEALDLPVSVRFVEWPFPYGTPSNAHNQFAQTGALNHFRARFGPGARWCLSLDMDEYLVAGPGISLPTTLRGHGEAGVAAVLLDSWFVPPYEGQPPVAERRAGLHSFRSRGPSGSGMKYAYRPERIRHNAPHAAHPSTWPGERLARFLHASVPKRLGRLGRSAARIFRGAGLGRKVRLASLGDLAFLHFRGLNTDWKEAEKPSGKPQAFNPQAHVKEPRIRDLARWLAARKAVPPRKDGTEKS